MGGASTAPAHTPPPSVAPAEPALENGDDDANGLCTRERIAAREKDREAS